MSSLIFATLTVLFQPSGTVDLGPPLHGPLECNSVCVYYTCEATCSTGRTSDPDCLKACIEKLSKNCKGCKE